MKNEVIKVKAKKTRKFWTDERKALGKQIAVVAVTSLVGGAFMVAGSRGAGALIDKAGKKTK